MDLLTVDCREIQQSVEMTQMLGSQIRIFNNSGEHVSGSGGKGELQE